MSLKNILRRGCAAGLTVCMLLTLSACGDINKEHQGGETDRFVHRRL